MDPADADHGGADRPREGGERPVAPATPGDDAPPAAAPPSDSDHDDDDHDSFDDDGGDAGAGDDGPREYEFVNPAMLNRPNDGDDDGDDDGGATADAAHDDPPVGVDGHGVSIPPVHAYALAPSGSGLEAVPEEGGEGEDAGDAGGHGGSGAASHADGGGSSAREPASVEPSPRLVAGGGASADGEDEDGAGDAVASSLSTSDVAQLVEMRLRQLEREYVEVAGRSAVDAERARADGAGGGGRALPADKAAKLAQLRAALAAARAATSAGGAAGGGVAQQPTMELAPGADEFPDDYDELQAADATALAASASSSAAAAVSTGEGDDFDDFQAAAAPPAAAASTAAASAPVAAAPAAVQMALTGADFDPFGAAGGGGKSKRGAPTPAPAAAASRGRQSATSAATAARAVSPLPDERKAAIADVMSRIHITPRGRPSAASERIVQAALQARRTAAAAPATSNS
jgi:hypothetical protein